MTETVSGREYTSTRVRGFADWSPRPDTLRLVQRVQGILAQYQAQLPLTIRQIFYVLVGSAEGYPKTEQAYARLAETLNRARRARMIRFSSIRDDGTQSEGGAGWSGPDAWMRAIRHYAEAYEHDLTQGQDHHVELWVEAGGMVPQAANVAGDYGIVTYSAGGFNGLTDKYETASRLARQDRPSIVLHCGDYDPSGLSIIDALAQDVTALAAGLGSRDVEFRRIVVTPRQIADYALPSAPQKGTDRRGEWMDETVQAEALPPDVLAAEIREAIEDTYDLDQLADMRELGARERTQILRTLDQLGSVDDDEEDEDE
jgi:hypothetical protein